MYSMKIADLQKKSQVVKMVQDIHIETSFTYHGYKRYRLGVDELQAIKDVLASFGVTGEVGKPDYETDPEKTYLIVKNVDCTHLTQNWKRGDTLSGKISESITKLQLGINHGADSARRVEQ